MLPKAAQAVLEQRFVRATSSLEACQRSADGTTTKLLVRLQDGLQVEAVVITYSHPGARPPRDYPDGLRRRLCSCEGKASCAIKCFWPGSQQGPV